VGETPGSTARLANLSVGQIPVLSFPSSESVIFPAHLSVQTVSTWMTTSPAGRIWAPILVPIFARLMRSVLRDPVLGLASASAPASDLRSQDPFEVRVVLTGEKDSRYAAVTGAGAYDLTADIAVFAARRLADLNWSQFGVLPPSALCPPAEFFTAASQWGVSFQEGQGD
jgi:hypothetical protein